MSGTIFPSGNNNEFLGPSFGVNRLYDNIMADMPSVTLPVVQLALWNTIEEFFIRSTSKREFLNWTMAAGIQQIDFNPYDEVWLVAWILQFRGLDHWLIKPPALLVDLNQALAQRNGSVLLALKPVSFTAFSQSAAAGDFFSTRYETVEAGVRWRLFKQPAKPWTSPQLADYNGKMYFSGIAAAKAEAQANFTYSGGRWGVPYFAHGRRKN